MKEKAVRNKTIDFSLEEGRKYAERCIKVNGVVDLEHVKNEFIIGNCLDVMKYLPNNFVDLLIVDPPYNLAKNYNGNKFYRQSSDDYRNYTISWVERVVPLLKEKASIYVCCDWRSSLIIGDVLFNYFRVQNRITWQREKGRGAKTNWKNSMEDVWFATMGKEYTFNVEAVKTRKKVIAPYRVNGKPKDWEETVNGNYRNTYPSNFWDDISIPYWSMAENTAHPTQKPEKLIAKMILASSNEGDFVFDPFAGSGTTAVTANKLNRNYVVIEQEELFGAWGQKRLEMAKQITVYRGTVMAYFGKEIHSLIRRR